MKDLKNKISFAILVVTVTFGVYAGYEALCTLCISNEKIVAVEFEDSKELDTVKTRIPFLCSGDLMYHVTHKWKFIAIDGRQLEDSLFLGLYKDTVEIKKEYQRSTTSFIESVDAKPVRVVRVFN